MNKYESFLVERRIAADRVYPISEAMFASYEEFKLLENFDPFEEVLGGKIMKLYEVPRNTFFKLSNSESVVIPPDALEPIEEETYKTLNLDGMYYNCLDSSGRRVYFAAWSDVEIVR